MVRPPGRAIPCGPRVGGSDPPTFAPRNNLPLIPLSSLRFRLSRRRTTTATNSRARPSWGATWTAATSPRPRRWLAGWDLDDACPPTLRRRKPTKKDPNAVDATPGRRGWREVGAVGGQRWIALHTARAGVVEVLRQAGYIQRNRWGRVEMGQRKHGPHVVADWRYSSEAGPVAGLPAVDAWRVARKLVECSGDWRVNLRIRKAGDLTAMALPTQCGLGHICPVCAAGRASSRAGALRAVLAAHHGGQEVALVTLTQRAIREESLQHAQGRLRTALDLISKGRPGRTLKSLVEGWWTGLEVTYNDKPGARWWHAHAHLIVVLAPGVEVEAARAWIGEAWARASEAAAVAAGQPGAGWEPVAGGCTVGANGKIDDWAGGWWRPVKNDEEVYQACKYPTPITDLQPAQMAEFLAVAHGRRWHYGAGCLQRVAALAEQLDDDGWGLDELPRRMGNEEDRTEGAPAIDLGRSVSSMAPREAPALDEVAPGLGIGGEYDPLLPADGWVSFRLARAAVAEVALLPEAVEGLVVDEYGAVRLYLPRGWVGKEVVHNAAALRLRRLDTHRD